MWLSYKKTYQKVLKVFAGLYSLNIIQGKGTTGLLGIMSLPREEAIIADFACIGSGLSTVCLLEKESDSEFLCKITELELRYLFTDKLGFDKVTRIVKSGHEHSLQKIIVFDEVSEEDMRFYESTRIEITHFSLMLKNQPCYLFQEPNPKSVCLYAYTNGTTGKSKLVKYTHEDLISSLTPIIFQSFNIRSDDVYVLYTNIALFGERLMLYTLMIYGVSIAFTQSLSEDLPLIRPTIILAIPRVLEFIQKSIKVSISQKSGISEKIFTKCFNSSLCHFHKTGTFTKNLFNNLAFASIRERFGGRIRLMLTGSAPSNPETLDFIQVCLGAEIYEGYGLVETGYSNFYGRRYVLKPLIGTQAKLEYLPEINIEGLAKDKYGELCLKLDKFSTTNNENQWIKTGDLFMLNEKNFTFKFLERISFCIQVQCGYSVFPQKLELLYRQNPLIAQLLIVGDKRINGVVAIVVVDEAFVRGYWGNSFLLEEIKENDLVKQEICSRFDQIAREKNLKDWEYILGVVIETQPWITSDVVTGSLKLRRHVLKEKYAGNVEDVVRRLEGCGNNS